MINLSKLLKSLIFSAIIFCLAPYLLYFLIMGVWRIQYMAEDFFQTQAINRATSVIEPFYVDGQFYDITTIIFGVANSEIEYSREGDAFSIDRINYDIDSGVFHRYASGSLNSYEREGYDIDLINDICTVLNGYNLDYEFLEGYGYRGFFYGDGYVYGSYSASYLHGQYIEITLKPTEGKNIVLRFDLELDPDSLDYQIISDLKAMEHASEQDRVNSLHNILALITPLDKSAEPEEEREPQILVIS